MVDRSFSSCIHWDDAIQLQLLLIIARCFASILLQLYSILSVSVSSIRVSAAVSPMNIKYLQVDILNLIRKTAIDHNK